MRRVFILIMAVLMLFTAVHAAAAFGVSPARKTVDYSNTVTGTIKIINSNSEDLSLVIAPKGDLAKYVSLKEYVIQMNSSQYEKDVSYTISIPDGVAQPGSSTIDFYVLSVQSAQEVGNNKISAAAGIISELVINVPYAGKQIKARIDYDSKTNTVIVPVFSLGTENINSVQADITVLGPTNAVIQTKSSESRQLPAKGTVELPVNLDSLNPGTYSVKALITYDGKTMSISKTINVGKPLVVIQGITFPDYNYGGISKIEINARNEWNQPVSNVYAIVGFYSSSGDKVDSVKTATTDIPAFGKAALDAYWDTSGYALGQYNIKATIYGGSTRQEITSNITLTGKDIIYKNNAAGKATSEGSNIALLALGVAFLVIINIILLFIILRKRKK